MKLLITGGCGFLGTNLSHVALQRGDDLTVVDNLYREGAAANLRWLQSQGTFSFRHVDVRSANEMRALVADVQPEGIFHLAGQVAMTTSIADPRMDFEVNVLGTFNLLDAIRQTCPSAALLYASTNKVYGDLEQYTYIEQDTRYTCREYPQGFDEGVPLHFESPYGCSKGAADQYVLDAAKLFGLRTAVFRHSSIYGGRQYATFDQGWIGWFCMKALEAKRNDRTSPFTISGNGKQVRDILHATDAVALYFGALEGIDGICGRAFNIGGGMANSFSLLELFVFLERELKVTMQYRQLAPRSSDQKVFVADHTAIESAVGWRPRVDKEQGVRAMLEWLASQAG